VKSAIEMNTSVSDAGKTLDSRKWDQFPGALFFSPFSIFYHFFLIFSFGKANEFGVRPSRSRT
jgi:hypothetical protein